MKIAFLKSIRFQIIVLYLLILTATLGTLRFVLYVQFRKILRAELDSKLKVEADGVENAIRTYWQTQKLEMSKDWFDSNVFFRKKDTTFTTIASQLTVEKLNPNNKDDLATATFIFDVQGGLIASSQSVRDIAVFEKYIKSAFETGHIIYDSFKIDMVNSSPVPVRMISKPIIDQNKVKYIVAVVASEIPLNKYLYQMKRNFFLQIPLILIVAVAGALFLVKATLSPVDEMAHTIRQIKPDNLTLRLKVPRTDDEIARLAETFNKMLDIMERSFAAQRQIVQDISHELKTPLTILQGQQEVALRKDRTPDDYKNILISNLEEIEKMKDIVTNLLLLAKFDKQHPLGDIERVDLNSLAQKVVDDMATTAKTKNIKLKFTRHADEIYIDGNKTYLLLVIKNILDNAIKYTPAGGEVNAEVNIFKPFALFIVRDTGIGIDEHDLELIFDRFYRVDKARSNGEGFGLGLSIVQAIVELHKGKVLVKSQINKGSTFEVYFPIPS